MEPKSFVLALGHKCGREGLRPNLQHAHVCTPLAERDQTETINADRNGMEANELGKQHGKRGS